MTPRRGIALSLLACVMAGCAVAKADDGLTEYPLPADQSIGQAAGPRAIVSGPGGALWFIENQGKLGRIAPDGKLLEPRRILGDDGAIHQLIALGDGSLWVLANGVPGHDQATLGRVEPSGATQWLAPTDTGLSSMQAIAPASDGRSLWAIGDDGLHGQVYLVDGSGSFRLVKGIPNGIGEGPMVAGGDGAAWWGDNSQGLNRMTPDGAQDRYGIPSDAYSLALGPGPGVWYVTKAADSLANSASSGGVLTSYAIPEIPPPLLQRGYIFPLDLVYQARDDALWIAAAGSVVRLTGQGNTQVYFLPADTLVTRSRIVAQITVGPDGALWFTEPHPQSAGIPDPDPGAIARLDPSAVPAFCAHSPSVSVPLREAALPSVELKSMARALDFAVDQESTLGMLVTVALFATPAGEEIVVTSLLGKVLFESENAAKDVLGDIANDPPDPSFRKIATPVIHPGHVRVNGRVTRVMAAALNRLLASQARIRALEVAYLHAVERSQGAAAAGDNTWVTRQDLAAADYAGRLAKAYARDAQLRRRVAAAVSHSPLRKVHITKRQLKAAKRKLAHGVPPGARRMLHRAGYTATEITALARRARQAKVSPTTPGALIAGLPVQQLAPQAVSAFEHVAARATCVANG